MIRTVQIGELKTITDLARQYWQASPHGQRYNFDWDSTLTFLRTCAINQASEIAVLTYDGEPVGFGIGFLIPLCFSTGHRASVEFIYIQQPHSRQDNYEQLLAYFETWAQQRGAVEISTGDYAPVSTSLDNRHTDLGYEYTGQMVTKRLNND